VSWCRIGRRALLAGVAALLGTALLPAGRGAAAACFFTDGTDFRDGRA